MNLRHINPITKSWNPFSGKSIADESALQDNNFLAATIDWSYKKRNTKNGVKKD